MITTYETRRSAFNVADYGSEPIYSAYQIKDYRLRKPDEISTSSLKRLDRLIDQCYSHRGQYIGNWFVIHHKFYQEKPMLLRKEKYKNDFPDHIGQHLIIVRRMGGKLFSLRFMRYGKVYTYVRLYRIDKKTFNRLVATYGSLIRHSRVLSEYILSNDRRYYDIWLARYKRHHNTYVVYPNHTAQKLDTSPNKLSKKALDWKGWQLEFDTEGNRWLVTTFKINRKDL